MKKFLRFNMLLLLAGFIAAGCSKDDGTDSPDAPGIPLDDRESIEIPNAVVSDRTKIIGDEWEERVADVSDSTIIISGDNVELPQVGDILLKTEITDKFPCGFLGRVVEVKNSGGTAEIATESVALDEAFEELELHFSENLSEYANEAYDANSQSLKINKVKGKYQKAGGVDEIFLSLPLNIHDGTMSASGTLRVALNFDFDINIKNFQLNYLNAAINPKIDLSADFSISVKGKAKDELELASIPFAAIPVGPLVIIPKINIMAVVGVDGKVELQTTLSYSQSASYGIKYENSSFNPYMNSTSDKPFNMEAIFSLDGKLYVGTRFALLCSFYGTNTGIGLGVTPKMAANAHFEIDIAKFAGGEFYNTFKQATLKRSVLLDGDVYVMAKIFRKTLAKYELYTPEFEVYVISENYLLPHFSDLTKDEATTNSAKISYAVPNNIFFPANIGMAVYDAAGNLAGKQYHAVSHYNVVNYKYNFTFSGLDKTKTYTAVPLVKFGILPEITATPQLSFRLQEDEPNTDGVVINGVCWATRNVDAPGTFAETPESAGMFYQWNRSLGWSSSNPLVNSNGGTTWDNSAPSGT
ncbi:MAG: hypothetical protein LBR34_01040, partial [Prevotella sp.]|nr:hypothetical protein [Prevotella sp.]